MIPDYLGNEVLARYLVLCLVVHESNSVTDISIMFHERRKERYNHNS